MKFLVGEKSKIQNLVGKVPKLAKKRSFWGPKKVPFFRPKICGAARGGEISPQKNPEICTFLQKPGFSAKKGSFFYRIRVRARILASIHGIFFATIHGIQKRNISYGRKRGLTITVDGNFFYRILFSAEIFSSSPVNSRRFPEFSVQKKVNFGRFFL